MAPPSIASAVVEIVADRRIGSGILLGPTLVLTALHVSGDSRQESGCRVRAGTAAGGSWIDATPIWSNISLDAALLVPRSRVAVFRQRGTFPLPRFGRLGANGRECRVIGFPASAANARAQHLNAVDVEASLRPHAYEREGCIGCAVRSPVISGEAWQGMSGAPALVGRWIGAMVVQRAAEFGAGLLKCTPTELLCRQLDFVARVEKERRQPFPSLLDDLDSIDAQEFNRPALVPPLEMALRHWVSRCGRASRPLRNLHRLLVAFEVPGKFTVSVFEELGSGLAGKSVRWLKSSIEQDASRPEPGQSWPFRWDEDPVLERARERAVLEGSRHVDERHWLLAVLAEPSGTTNALRRGLGETRFTALLEAAERLQPAATPGRASEVLSFPGS
jgi:hypothetical protein